MMRKALVILAIAALCPLASGGEASAVRFEATGLSVDGTLVAGTSLELRSTGNSAMLASARCVEPLSGSVSIELAAGRTLTVEPGVRLERTTDGFRLSSAAGRPVSVSGPDGEISLAPAVDFNVEAEGWLVAGQPVTAAYLEAALPQQDGAGSLGRMRQASQRMAGRRPLTTHRHRTFSNGNPAFLAASVESQIVRQPTFTSPAGF